MTGPSSIARWLSAQRSSGLICVPDTPRAIDDATALRLGEAARAVHIDPVIVSRDRAMARVAGLAAEAGAHVQLHGGEDGVYIAQLRKQLPAQAEIWAAIPVSDQVGEAREGSDRSLFDTSVGGRSGGTGRSFDWSLVAGRPELADGLLAGGIGPANARRAAATGAFALDVGSSVESRPGRKDPAKVAALLEALRPADRREAA
ncbi:MAG: N-(5'-phosphoribosyl)anthranilate isomerase [Sphingomonadales bacterium]|nr:N-(5'-phosphoribosyl)anthranilate isomerase [Sphingomonadales bacterium]